MLLLAIALFAGPLACAPASPRTSAAPCERPAAEPIAELSLPGNPFQAIPSADGCHVFVSLVGPSEPGDPPRPPRPGAPKGGVAVVSRAGGAPTLVRVVTLEGSPYGMVLTHDGRLLIVASDDRVALLDVPRLVAGSGDAILGYLNDAPEAGRVYANVTADDRWLFLSDESRRAISVVDLARARADGFTPDAVIGQVPVGRAPIALTFSQDGRWLFTTSQEIPSSYGWPATCTPPAAEIAREGSKTAPGAILVIDVARATTDPARAVVGAAPAGCNPVRLVSSPRGDVVYVSARSDNTVLAFDAAKLVTDPLHARLGGVPVGTAPVGLAVFDGGARLAVTNSNRFGDGTATSSVTILDTSRVGAGRDAIVRSIPAGSFPRELHRLDRPPTLLLTNYGSKSLALIDVSRLSALPSPTR